MAAMPSPTASSLAATMPNLSRSGRRAVKRRSPGGEKATSGDWGAFAVIFLVYVGKKVDGYLKNACGVLEVGSTFCVFFPVIFFYLLRFFVVLV